MVASGGETPVESPSAVVSLSGICLRFEDGSDVYLDRDTVVVGSSGENDVVIDDPGVSRRHFQISRRPGGWFLQDLKSTNGTMVDRVRVVEIWLRSGMEIRAGRSVLHFVQVMDMAPPEPSSSGRFGSAVGQSRQMREIFGLLEKVSPTDATVLIEGETGSGKEVFARGIHQSSKRAGGPFVVFDCGATPRDLVESIMFGHERGAFTGAVTAREGLFEQARGGTLFLDELGELPMDVQPKLLRILDTREVRRVGGSKSSRVDVRLVAATNRRLEAEVAAGRFRADLFYRLAVVRINLPALRERPDDIPVLVSHFLSSREQMDGVRRAVSPQAMYALAQWSWPGNVRELFNSLERAVSLCPADVIDVQDLPRHIVDAAYPAAADDGDAGTAPMDRVVKSYAAAREECLEKFEVDYLGGLMEKCGDNIALAARCADMDRKYLRNLLKKHGLYRAGQTAGDVQD